MARSTLSLMAVLLVGSVVVADVPPVPLPPPDAVVLPISREVKLGKDVTGYVFVEEVIRGPGVTKVTYSKVEPATDKSVTMTASDKHTTVTLIAVPQDAAKEFKTDAELFDALMADKVKGAHTLQFFGRTSASGFKRVYTITAIDPKNGIKTKIEDVSASPSGTKELPKNDSDSDAAPFSLALQGGTVIAGASAFAAMTFAGFWLAGRVRRKA